MPPIDNAASGPDTGNAGADDGFAKAFDTAIQKIDLSGAEFAPAVMDPPAEREEEPVEETDEPAASPKPNDRNRVKAETAPEKSVAPAADVQAPAHWDAAKREAFAALPPEARKIVTDLTKGFEADYTRKSTELAEDRKFASSVRSLINDSHRSQMRRAGLSDEQGIAHLVRLNDLYTSDPVGYVKMVVERSGLDPSQIWNVTGTGQPSVGEQPMSGQFDPYSQLYGTISSLHGEVERIKRENEQATLRTVNRSIERFAQEKDAENNPTHPHFNKVQGVMIQLLGTPKYQAIDDYGERLRAAYDDAVYLDPDIRTQLVDADVQKRLKADREAADVAKARKAKAPVRAAPVSTGKPKPGTLDEAVRQSMGMLGVS